MNSWEQGFIAARDNGATYTDNPHSGKDGTAWAFGCGEGMKERNRIAFQAIMQTLQGE